MPARPQNNQWGVWEFRPGLPLKAMPNLTFDLLSPGRYDLVDLSAAQG
jgi:hypothetical protein